jgi:peptidoglycan-associated lipoprotein
MDIKENGMNKKRMFQCALVSVGLMGLAGCNLAGKNAKNSDASVASGVPGNTAANASAQTYGLNGSSDISGQDGSTASGATLADNAAAGSDGYAVNSTKAPENQTYYFGFNSYTVNHKDLPAIYAQANYLVQNPTSRVRLEGNTDDRGSREYNIGLGWRRDKAVQSVMEQQGVASNQIAMVSYGKERPAVVGDNPADWALNRRVNLVYERASS